MVGESGRDFTKLLLYKQYSEGIWSGTGPNAYENWPR